MQRLRQIIMNPHIEKFALLFAVLGIMIGTKELLSDGMLWVFKREVAVAVLIPSILFQLVFLTLEDRFFKGKTIRTIIFATAIGVSIYFSDKYIYLIKLTISAISIYSSIGRSESLRPLLGLFSIYSAIYLIQWSVLRRLRKGSEVYILLILAVALFITAEYAGWPGA